MSGEDKPLVWLRGEVQTPPFTSVARVEAGVLLRRLQRGDVLGLPHSRPMPVIGARCHELRIQGENVTWRLVYRIEPDAVIILDVFSKKTSKTPTRVVASCKERLRRYLREGK